MKPRYPSTQLKQVVWRLKDVEEIPAGFSRTEVVRDPSTAFKRLRFLFDELAQEQFVVVLLDTRNSITAIDIVGVGTINASLVHPREVFRAAVSGLACSILLAHNHPSGNPEPSAEDVAITKQLVEAGKVLGIPVVDHLIFAGSNFTSLAERGII